MSEEQWPVPVRHVPAVDASEAVALPGGGFDGSVVCVPAVLQFAAIVILVAVGLMLLLVGAVGSGGICVVAAGVWFWRLYRAGDG